MNTDEVSALACKVLTSLGLSGCHRIADKGIKALASSLIKLTSLSWCTQINDKTTTVENIPKDSWRIIFELLGLKKQLWLFSLTKNPVIYFSESIKIYTRLDLFPFGNRNSIPRSYFTTLSSKCMDLKNLNLSGCNQITDEGLIALANNGKGLMSLSLDGCHQITNRGFIGLATALTKYNVS
ncbi:MAG TPA: hypothetical protein QF873_04245 [Patescibacteria group bacterium]|nr:hypothetical protein [Patescibacteria group bacterium]